VGDNSNNLATTAFVASQMGSYLPLAGGTVTGALTVNGAFTTLADVYITSANASTAALVFATCTNVRQWYWGVDTAGRYVVCDNSAGLYRFYINPDGTFVFPGTGTVSGNLYVSGSSYLTNASFTGQLTGTHDLAIQISAPAGQFSRFRSVTAGARFWDFGCDPNGNFGFSDDSVGATRLLIDTSGNTTVYQSLTVGANLQVNGSATVNSSATVNGNFYTNAISCTTLNTNNNLISCGPINANGIVNCVNGINYSNLGAGHTIGFSNSGTTLTFYAYGGSSGSWPFNSSDERLKENIAPARGDALVELNRLKLISFDLPFPDAPTRHFDYGVSAQNMQGIIPDAIIEGPEHLVVDTLPLIARLIGAVQQLTAKVAALEARA
jgi:hypothetical protein